MKFLYLAAVSLLFVACEEKADVTPVATAHKTGRNTLSPNYGSHAIRVEGGPINFRIYRIENGDEVIEHEFTLDPGLHEQAWVTPSEFNNKVRIEFGAHEWPTDERSGNPIKMGGSWPEWIVEYDIPHTLGGGPSSIRISPDKEKVFLRYTLVKEANVDLLGWETMTREVMASTSKTKPISFYIVTVSPK